MAKANWTEVFYLAGGFPSSDFKERLKNLTDGFLDACSGLCCVSIAVYSLPKAFLVAQHFAGPTGAEGFAVPEAPGGFDILEGEEMVCGDNYTTLTLPVHINGICAAIRMYSRKKNFFNNFVYLREIKNLVNNLSMAFEIYAIRQHLELQNGEFIHSLAQAIDARDSYTRQHSSRVAFYAVLLGLACGLSSCEIDIIRQGALLHDIGKLAVPDRVLFKKDRLSVKDCALIRVHPVAGAHIVRSRALKELVPIVLNHHERVDGSGYPRGLEKSKIPLEAQIVGIADVYEALTADRVYRNAMTSADARRMLAKGMSGEFSTNLLETFFGVLNDLAAERPGTDTDRGCENGDETNGLVLKYFNNNPYAVSSAFDIANTLQIDISVVKKVLDNLALRGSVFTDTAYDCVYYYRLDVISDGSFDDAPCYLSGDCTDDEMGTFDSVLGALSLEPLTGVSGKKELLAFLNDLIVAGGHFCLKIFHLDSLSKVTGSYSGAVVMTIFRNLLHGLKELLPDGSKIYRPEEDLLAFVVPPFRIEWLALKVDSLVTGLNLGICLKNTESCYPEDGETALELYYCAAGRLRSGEMEKPHCLKKRIPRLT